MDIVLLKSLLRSPIAFQPIFVKIAGSVNAGLLLSQAFYWSDKTTDPNGWFYKTQAEWEKETYLTRYEQESARKQLRSLGFWEETLEGIPAKLFYRINMGALYAKMVAVSKIESSSMRENHILESGNPANRIGVKPHTTICTESTSENTSPELKNSGNDRVELFAFPEGVEKPIIHSNPPAKRGRPPKPADPRHQEAIEMWRDMWNERFNTPYSFHSKDFKHLKEFLRANPSVEVSKMRDALSGIWSLEVQKGAFAPNSIRILNLCDLCLRWNTIIGNIQ